MGIRKRVYHTQKQKMGIVIMRNPMRNVEQFVSDKLFADTRANILRVLITKVTGVRDIFKNLFQSLKCMAYDVLCM